MATLGKVPHSKRGAEGRGGGGVCFTSKNSAQIETNIEFLIWKFEELGSNPHTRKTSEQNLKCENRRPEGVS
jgi:hypothetical protein